MLPFSAILDAFLTRWRDADGSERANHQLFVGGLCAVLDLPAPEPATGQLEQGGYVFERRVAFQHGDGSESAGFIDLYRRGAFVLEAKRLKPGVTTKGFDTAHCCGRAGRLNPNRDSTQCAGD